MQTSARLSQRLTGIHEGLGQRSYEIEIAQTGAQRLAAARLVGAVYRREGYLAEAAGQVFYALHHLLDETVIFVAREEGTGRLLGTLALVQDSPAGLPMDPLYRCELDALRAQGRRICEFCSLVVERDLGSCAPGLLLALFRASIGCAFYAFQADDVCVAVRPKHAAFYRRLLFVPLGGLRRDMRFKDPETTSLRLASETVCRFRSNQEAQLRNPISSYCSEPLDPAECHTYLRARNQALRSEREIRAALERQPALLEEATPAASAYLARTLSSRRVPRVEEAGHSAGAGSGRPTGGSAGRHHSGSAL